MDRLCHRAKPEFVTLAIQESADGKAVIDLHRTAIFDVRGQPEGFAIEPVCATQVGRRHRDNFHPDNQVSNVGNELE